MSKRQTVLKEDDLVKSLVSDPADVPELRLLIGWLGRSAREDRWRLYSNAELDQYIEVKAEDIVHARQLKESESPTGGTMLWVRRTAALREIRAGSPQAQASFLDGQLMAMLNRADIRSQLDLSAFPGQIAATTVFCFTGAATLTIVATAAASHLSGYCKKIRSEVFPTQC